MVNAELLGKMKETAFLINTSRGPVINEADLYEALKNGQLASAPASTSALRSRPAPATRCSNWTTA